MSHFSSNIVYVDSDDDDFDHRFSPQIVLLPQVEDTLSPD